MCAKPSTLLLPSYIATPGPVCVSYKKSFATYLFASTIVREALSGRRRPCLGYIWCTTIDGWFEGLSAKSHPKLFQRISTERVKTDYVKPSMVVVLN